MITKISSLTFSGVDIIDVDVQVQITPGVPNFIIVGLADKTIAESKERVRAALSSIGLALPAKESGWIPVHPGKIHPSVCRSGNPETGNSSSRRLSDDPGSPFPD